MVAKSYDACQSAHTEEADMSRYTRHNSVDSVLTSNLVCIREVAIRTTLSHMINMAGTI